MKLLFASTAAAVALLTGSVAAADSLYGTQVTLTGDLPKLGTPFTTSVTKTVGPGVEFPNGTLTDIATGTSIIGVNVDVGMSTLNFSYTQGAVAISAPFNGYVFDFNGATITGASLDPSSTFTSQQVGVAFGPNDVSVNVEGLSFSPSSHLVLDLSVVASPVTSSVPEPKSSALLLAGLGVAALGVRATKRRKQQSPA